MSRRRSRCDRGASTVELVLLLPLVMLLTAGVVQFALFLFARQVATSAAQAGARVARAQAEDNPAGWQAAAQDAAADRIAAMAPTLLENVQISAITPGADLVGIRVQADATNLWPDWLVPDIDLAAAGPREEFRPDS